MLEVSPIESLPSTDLALPMDADALTDFAPLRPAIKPLRTMPDLLKHLTWVEGLMTPCNANGCSEGWTKEAYAARALVHSLAEQTTGRRIDFVPADEDELEKFLRAYPGESGEMVTVYAPAIDADWFRRIVVQDTDFEDVPEVVVAPILGETGIVVFEWEVR